MEKLTFQSFGAAGMVTGSKHVIITPKGRKILLDCGLVQGHNKNKEDLNRNFGFEPKEIDCVILSHAHIDHSGLLPRLVREGFDGKIFATPATIDLCRIMLADSAHIQIDDLRYVNKRRRERQQEDIEPLYDEADVLATFELFEPVPYHFKCTISDEASFEFTDAGHLLGSAAVHLDIKHAKGKGVDKITFTGDIGRYKTAILKDPETFRQCDFLICESTYGDRLHASLVEAEQEILNIVKHTCVHNRGKVIIPSFSVGRTQTIVYALDRLKNQGLLPNIKIFVDSPLSVKATEVMSRHRECYDDEILEYMKKDSTPFGFKNLFYISRPEDSKGLNSMEEPCVIISASGMAEAGRIKHHIKNNIEDPKNTIMMVGYCTPESLGGRLKNGDKEVKIFGEWYPVRAQVLNFESYSAHGDYEDIFHFLACQKMEKIKKVFLVHGEPDTLLNFKEKFMKKGFNEVLIPHRGEAFRLD